jgi:Protein of unknown function (DUF938)
VAYLPFLLRMLCAVCLCTPIARHRLHMAQAGGETHNVVQSTSAAQRNKAPIEAALRPFLEPLAAGSLVLEVASGHGVHVSHLATAFTQLEWQPTEFQADNLAVIDTQCASLSNVRPAVPLDSSAGKLPNCVSAGSLAAVLAVNLTHIAPWSATTGLLAIAADGLKPGGHLFIYGPFLRDGQHTSEGNASFDESLRARDSTWGYRDIDAVLDIGAKHGLKRTDVVSMPANNFMLILTRTE